MFNKKSKIIAINCGYYNLKVKTKDREYIIESRIQQNDDASNYIEIEGTRYEIGEGYRDLSIRTESEVQDILTKYAILDNSEEDTITDIVVALPMGVYLNSANREIYKQKIKSIDRMTAKVNGKLKTARIGEVTVYMEGAAAVLAHTKKFADKAVGLIDIGGNTINCAVFRNCKLQKDSITQLDLGMIMLERHIIDTLNTMYSLNIQDYEIRDILKHKKFEADIRKMQNIHVEKLRQKLIEKKWNVDLMDILATGGGSQDLASNLRSSFTNLIVSDTPIYDNVRGMYIAGEVISKER